MACQSQKGQHRTNMTQSTRATPEKKSLRAASNRSHPPLSSWPRYAHTWGRGRRRCCRSSRRRGRRGPPCPGWGPQTPPASSPPTWSATSTCPGSPGWWSRSEWSWSASGVCSSISTARQLMNKEESVRWSWCHEWFGARLAELGFFGGYLDWKFAKSLKEGDWWWHHSSEGASTCISFWVFCAKT